MVGAAAVTLASCRRIAERFDLSERAGAPASTGSTPATNAEPITPWSIQRSQGGSLRRHEAQCERELGGADGDLGPGDVAKCGVDAIQVAVETRCDDGDDVLGGGVVHAGKVRHRGSAERRVRESRTDDSLTASSIAGSRKPVGLTTEGYRRRVARLSDSYRQIAWSRSVARIFIRLAAAVTRDSMVEGLLPGHGLERTP